MHRHFKEKLNSSSYSYLLGRGYSADIQQPVGQNCYQGVILGAVSNEKYIEKGFLKDFGNPFPLYNSNESFARFLYLDKVADKKTINIKYFTTIFYEVSFNTSAAQMTDYARSIYKNAFSDFGMLCGDKYLSGIKVGLILYSDLYLQFDTEDAEREFKKACLDHGTKCSIQDLMSYNPSSISISVNQAGGDQSNISHLFNNIGDFVNYESGLQKQLTKDNVVSLVKYGRKFFEISDIPNTKMPPSLVTASIKSARDDLSKAFTIVNIYGSIFSNLFTSYPVQWDEDSNIYYNLQKIYNDLLGVRNNIFTDNSCYSDQMINCVDTVEALKSQIPALSKIQNILKPIKYTIEIGNPHNKAILYRCCDGVDGWKVADAAASIGHLIVEDQRYQFTYQDRSGKYTAVLSRNGDSYSGEVDKILVTANESFSEYLEDVFLSYYSLLYLIPAAFSGAYCYFISKQIPQRVGDVRYSHYPHYPQYNKIGNNDSSKLDNAQAAKIAVAAAITSAFLITVGPMVNYFFADHKHQTESSEYASYYLSVSPFYEELNQCFENAENAELG